MPKTSKASSTPRRRFRPLTPQSAAQEASAPMTRAAPGATRPAAGVMPTSPAMAPEAAPSSEAWPFRTRSASAQASTPQAAASKVLAAARTACPLAASADPPLKPNQPTHSSAAPVRFSGRLWGSIASRPYPRRGPTQRAPTRPATPALMWTTVPPAKSSAPRRCSQPSPAQTMCAIGR